MTATRSTAVGVLKSKKASHPVMRVLGMLVLAFLGGTVQSGFVKAQDAIGGHWKGVASREGADLPIEFDFRPGSNGLQGFVSASTLGGFNVPLKDVSLDGSSLRFQLPTDGGTFAFSGTVRGDSLTGSWNLFGFESQVAMSRTVAAPMPYTSEEVSCRNGGVTLAGTLMMPESPRVLHPAVVFVHGSGTSPRQAFNFWADQFTRLGMASLIFDKRGSGSSTGDWHDADFSDLAGDVLACVEVLKAHRDIDTEKIGLFGQSQGGWVAPLAASRSRDIAFLILVSGAPVTPARQGWWEAESKLRKGGLGQDAIDRARSLWRMNDDVTRTGQGLAALQSTVERVRGEPWPAALGLAKPPPIDSTFRRFFRRIMDFDPVPVLQTVSVPSLWIYGGRDEVVPATESAAILETLKSQGKDITVTTFPTADHTIYIAANPQPFRWMGFAPGYVETVTDWASRRVNAAR